MNGQPKPFGFTPSKPFGFNDEKKMHIPIPEDDRENPSQKNFPSPNNDKLDLQAQIHLSTQKIDPKSLSPLHIYISVSGMIESGECGAEESLQLKYDILSGRDWKLLAVSFILNHKIHIYIYMNFHFDKIHVYIYIHDFLLIKFLNL